jgi:hypothetical protein
MARRHGPTQQAREPTELWIRAVIEAKIDRLMALEELSWELKTFVDDLWGPVPAEWSQRMAELGGVHSEGGSLATDAAADPAWEAGRARILAGFSAHERWLIGLSDHLWAHVFEGGREAIRQAAVDSFLAATLAYIRQHPDIPPLSSAVRQREH